MEYGPHRPLGLDAVFAEKTVDEWLAVFAGVVPVGPVYGLDAALDNPFLDERGSIQSYDHPVKGTLRVLTSPIRDNGETLPVNAAPPLGADTDDILGELGYTADDIARGVVFLTADDAGFVTGSTLSINGGQHMY